MDAAERWVKEQLARGYTREEVRTTLLRAGYRQSDLDRLGLGERHIPLSAMLAVCIAAVLILSVLFTARSIVPIVQTNTTIIETAPPEGFYPGSILSEPVKIALVVDAETYESLRSEIDGFAKALNEDTRAQTKILSGNYSAPQDVKNALLAENGLGNVDGGFLIGNIPWVHMRINGSSTISVSDHWYFDFDNPSVERVDTQCAIDSTCSKKYVEVSIVDLSRWHARVFPAGNSSLKGYFGRNVQNRALSASFDTNSTVCTIPWNCATNIFSHGLVSHVTTAPDTSARDVDFERAMLLGGARIYQAKQPWHFDMFLGDPTLRVNLVPPSGCRLAFNQTDFHLGSITVKNESVFNVSMASRALKVRNDGTENCELRYVTGIPSGSGIVLDTKRGFNSGNLAPAETLVLVFSLVPPEGFLESEKRDLQFAYPIRFVSNDPQYLRWINVRGTFTKA